MRDGPTPPSRLRSRVSPYATLVPLCAALACSSEPDEPGVRFVDVAQPAVPGSIVVGGASVAEARTALLEALDETPGAPVFVGRAPWRTRVLVRGNASPDDALARGRSFVFRGDGDLRLDLRLGAGDRGGFAGDVVPTGAARVMLQVRLEDPSTLEARFRIRILADDGPAGNLPADVTPRFLRRPVPRGTYRASVDAAAGGARFTVEVSILAQDGSEAGHAWSSPIAVERPWLGHER